MIILQNWPIHLKKGNIKETILYLNRVMKFRIL
jgi:hypothetical protein